MFVQRPIYDKTSLGYLLSQSAKKLDERKEPDPKHLEAKEDLNKIDSNQYVDVPKVNENVNQSGCIEDPKKA